METLARTQKVGWTLMVLALVYWALAGALIPSSWEWKMTAMNAVGAVAFFTVACFLPEYRGMRLPNRRFALRLSAFFVFLGIREAQETESAREYFRMSNADIDGSEPIVSFVAMVILYYLFVFLIRAFRGGARYKDAVSIPATGPTAIARRGKRLVTGYRDFPR